MAEVLQIINVLLIPLLVYAVRIEHRLTRVEGLADRVEKLEKKGVMYGGQKA